MPIGERQCKRHTQLRPSPERAQQVSTKAARRSLPCMSRPQDACVGNWCAKARMIEHTAVASSRWRPQGPAVTFMPRRLCALAAQYLGRCTHFVASAVPPQYLSPFSRCASHATALRRHGRAPPVKWPLVTLILVPPYCSKRATAALTRYSNLLRSFPRDSISAGFAI